MVSDEMREIARQERNRYAREWRAKNKDKAKAITENYWMRRAEKIRKEREASENISESDTEAAHA